MISTPTNTAPPQVCSEWGKPIKTPISIGIWKDVSRLSSPNSCITIIEAKPKKTASEFGVTPAMSRIALIHEVAVSKKFEENSIPYVIALRPQYHAKLEKSSQLKSVHMEDCTLKDASILSEKPPATIKELIRRLTVAKQTAIALAGIHALQWAHNDVKPNNIFLTLDRCGQISVRLGDFAFARKIGGKIVGKTGTLIYLPPEVVGSYKVESTAATDLWALGLTLLELYHGEGANLFFRYVDPDHLPTTPTELKYKWLGIRNSIVQTLNINDPVDALIGELLSTDPKQRPQAGDVAARLADSISRFVQNS